LAVVLVLAFAVLSGLSVSLAPTARAALAVLTGDRAATALDESGGTVAGWGRACLSAKTHRMPSVGSGPGAGPQPVALCPIVGAAVAEGPGAASVGRGAIALGLAAAGGHLSTRTPTGPPAA